MPDNEDAHHEPKVIIRMTEAEFEGMYYGWDWLRSMNPAETGPFCMGTGISEDQFEAWLQGRAEFVPPAT